MVSRLAFLGRGMVLLRRVVMTRLRYILISISGAKVLKGSVVTEKAPCELEAGAFEDIMCRLDWKPLFDN